MKPAPALHIPRREPARWPAWVRRPPAMCDGCDGLDVELVAVEGRELCPACVAQLAEERRP